MNPFTGGCHYDHYCGKYMTGCGACPQLGSDLEQDLSRIIWQKKREIFNKLEVRQINIVAPSHWLAKLCQKSSLLGRFQTSVIPNAVDTDDFAPRDRHFSRSVLGIPPNKMVILFVSEYVNDSRKGSFLLKDLSTLISSCLNACVIFLGKENLGCTAEIPHFHTGQVTNDRLLSLVYSAADILLTLSSQDNLPNTILEAMSCGTPVIGFAVGGIPDVVKNETTGFLARYRNIEKLCSLIKRTLTDESLRARLSENCRRTALKDYSLAIQARRYESLYDGILTGIVR
jgi:glycosyltransferase involved in cell wall biosynthesis